MSLKQRTSSYASRRIASFLGLIVLSSVLLPITLASPSYSASTALIPTFSTPITNAYGFTVNVTNYDAAFSYATKASHGKVAVGVATGATLPLTIQLRSRSKSTITVTTTRTGYVTGHSTIMGIRGPLTALVATISSPVSTATGFTVKVTNYYSAFSFIPTTSAGNVTLGKRHDHSITMTVTGLAPGTAATLSVATSRNGYAAGNTSVIGKSLLAALVPIFSTPVSTTHGFTINVTNFDPSFTYTTKTSKGHVKVGVATGANLPLIITDVNSHSKITITVKSNKAGYASGSATTTAKAL